MEWPRIEPAPPRWQANTNPTTPLTGTCGWWIITKAWAGPWTSESLSTTPQGLHVPRMRLTNRLTSRYTRLDGTRPIPPKLLCCTPESKGVEIPQLDQQVVAEGQTSSACVVGLNRRRPEKRWPSPLRLIVMDPKGANRNEACCSMDKMPAPSGGPTFCDHDRQ